MDEGYIKFNCHWIKADPLPGEMLNELNSWRQKLYDLGLIGMYDNGIGFGNLSIRHPAQGFVITGSATGGLPILDERHFVWVNAFDLEQNSLECRGPVIASSESLSHAVIYQASPETQAVIHVHHPQAWNFLIEKFPTTGIEVSYGTPAMAREILLIFRESALEKEKILLMGGHPEGIITFGHSLDDAGEMLLKHLKDFL
ncbi:MAG: class II aldolase/adducin family protein [Bacteroides sp.]|jgi:ribulose-5-phosphate 4-epimerase/fuculose-1-phosphate aldolase|nr:class II aldolase/adducin family protein [Bacteroides sp.]